MEEFTHSLRAAMSEKGNWIAGLGEKNKID